MSKKSYKDTFAYVIDQLNNDNKLNFSWSNKNGNIQPKDISRRTHAGEKCTKCINAF